MIESNGTMIYFEVAKDAAGLFKIYFTLAILAHFCYDVFYYNE